jgi:hypothetical protein
VSLAVVGLVVLGSLLFVVYTVVNFMEEASPLQARAVELSTDAELKRKRAQDYQARVEYLRDGRPDFDRKVKRLERWIDNLKAQKARLEAANPKQAGPERDKRAAAVRASMSTKWMGAS